MRLQPAQSDPKPEDNTTENNPILRSIESRRNAEAEARRRRGEPEEARKLDPQQERPELGSLSEDSLINSRLLRLDDTESAKTSVLGQVIPKTRVMALDPKPIQRRRWERKMVIREIQKRGRLSKAQILKRTERALTARSPFIKTSMKKLNPLANQIAGKPIEDAIVQMRFSKKKAAVDVRQQLEAARDLAIVERGMGLGQADESRRGMKTTVKLKDGTSHTILDRTGIYVDQAWVGKGSYGMDRNPRARGRIDKLSLPQTSTCPRRAPSPSQADITQVYLFC